MKRETIIWTILLIIGGGFLVGRAMFSEHGMGKAYVKVNKVALIEVPNDSRAEKMAKAFARDPENSLDPAANPPKKWVQEGDLEPDELAAAKALNGRTASVTRHEKSNYATYMAEEAASPGQTTYRLSLPRTIGTWIAALFTLFILSFLYRDNALYKIAESCVIGVSAAYWMVIGFWSTMYPNLYGKLLPDAARSWAMPGLGQDLKSEWLYLVPLALGVMLLWRLAPKGGWISRWPMAFIIGTFCGLRLIGFMHADFLTQIRNGIVPLWVTDSVTGNFDLWGSFGNLLLVIGVLTCLVYFFFSIEHKGVVGHTARVGIWFLMVTFGAAFGYTVMGRIALLAIRFEFLFDDWLWIIDPAEKHTVLAAVSLLQGIGF